MKKREKISRPALNPCSRGGGKEKGDVEEDGVHVYHEIQFPRGVKVGRRMGNEAQQRLALPPASAETDETRKRKRAAAWWRAILQGGEAMVVVAPGFRDGGDGLAGCWSFL